VAEHGRERLIADLEFDAELVLAEGCGVSVQGVQNQLFQAGCLHGRMGSGDLEMRIIAGEGERDRIRCAGGAMLDGQADEVVGSFEVEVGVAPGVEVAGPAQRLPGDGAVAFAGVVDQEDGELVATLKGAQVGQQCRDLGGGVFLETVEADEGIQDEKPGPVVLDGGGQTVLVGLKVEPELLSEDEEDGQRVEVHVACGGETSEAIPDLCRCVLGGEQEHGSGVVDRVAVQAGRAGSDGQGDLQSEVGLAALGSPADDAYGLMRPEVFDQPGGMAVRFDR
jgi:hypothetical protein